jgi:3-deoxy-D-manno-octulosonic acid (KDO) 8-phosphate synthase
MAISDGKNMIPIKQLYEVVEMLIEFDRLAKARPVSLPKESS